MVKWRQIPAAIIGVLALAGTVRADMMPVSPLDAGYRQSPKPRVTTAVQQEDSPSPAGWPGIVDLSASPVGPLSGSDRCVGQACQTQPVQILSDDQNSFSLCLYALIGLGLCRSAPLVKKLSFGCVPSWYHDGGPFQIGHNFAISPDCLCVSSAYCYIQPVCTAEEHIPRYHFATVVSLWRNLQFTPAALASRAPPRMS